MDVKFGNVREREREKSKLLALEMDYLMTARESR